jgi:DNA-binding NtrC family response regulator
VTNLVFVVDDTKRLSDLLAQALSDSGFEVESFYDAESALARSIERSPDILITDIEMPRMDGHTLARAVHERNPHCEIVLMSGNSRHNPNLYSRGNSTDSFAFLQKPFSLAQLLSIVSCLHRQRPPNEN